MPSHPSRPACTSFKYTTYQWDNYIVDVFSISETGGTVHTVFHKPSSANPNSERAHNKEHTCLTEYLGKIGYKPLIVDAEAKTLTADELFEKAKTDPEYAYVYNHLNAPPLV